MDMLIIWIDKDDDIGVKGGVKSPVIGRAASIDAATRLGTADPEDSDTNTIYGGIQVYDQLKAEGHNVELVGIAGHRELGVKSDRSIAMQLDDILLKYPTEKAILISDGAEDESVLPILQSRLKIEGVKRVVVKQAQNLESTYYIITKLVNDPKVARVIFIPLGIILLVYAATVLVSLPNAAPVAIATLLGGYLLYRGLGLDDLLETFVLNLKNSFNEAKLTFVTYLIAMVLIVMAVIQGAWGVWTSSTHYTIQPGYIDLGAKFFSNSIPWFIAGFMAIVIGWIIDAYMDDNEALYKYLSTPFFLVAAGLLIWGCSQYILNINDAVRAFTSLGEGIVLAIIVSYVGVLFAKQVKRITQYRTVETIDF